MGPGLEIEAPTDEMLSDLTNQQHNTTARVWMDTPDF